MVKKKKNKGFVELAQLSLKGPSGGAFRLDGDLMSEVTEIQRPKILEAGADDKVSDAEARACAQLSVTWRL